MVVLVQSVAKDNLPPKQKPKADFQDVFINSAGKTELNNLYELFSPCQESTLTLPLGHCSFLRLPYKIQIRGTQWICSPRFPSFLFRDKTTLCHSHRLNGCRLRMIAGSKPRLNLNTDKFSSVFTLVHI